MQTKILDDKKAHIIKYFPIFIPILIEQVFQTLIGSFDTIVLSKYSDNAVAAVGIANQIMVIGTMILGIVGIGTLIIITQLSETCQNDRIAYIIKSSLYLNIIISIIIYIVLIMFGKTLLAWIHTPSELIEMGYIYLKIVGFSLIFQGIMISFSSIFRGFTYVKPIMYISIFVNVLNCIGDYIVVLTPWTFLGKGIEGVSNSTLIARIIGGCIYIFLFSKFFKKYNFNIFKLRLKLIEIKAIFKLGLPSALESISYNISQTILTGLIASLGTIIVTSKIYTQSMTSFIFTITSAIAMTAQIIVGKLIGKGLKDEALKYGINKLYKGVSFIFLVALLLIPISRWIILIFTDNKSIIDVVVTLIILSVLLEPARAANSILISVLNSAGEVKFPVIVGLIITYIITIPLSYIVSIKMNFGIVGIWITSIIDEWIRATIFYIRWKKGNWRKIDIFS